MNEQERLRLCKLAGISYRNPIQRIWDKLYKKLYNNYQDVRFAILVQVSYVLTRLGLMKESTFFKMAYYGHKGYKE